jgi:hypothetical protein
MRASAFPEQALRSSKELTDVEPISENTLSSSSISSFNQQTTDDGLVLRKGYIKKLSSEKQKGWYDALYRCRNLELRPHSLIFPITGADDILCCKLMVYFRISTAKKTSNARNCRK